eukprot:7357630-Lingulodinium_polyedra.AAC.1
MVVGSAVGSIGPRSAFCCGLLSEGTRVDSAVGPTVDSPVECTVGPVARRSKQRAIVSPDQAVSEASAFDIVRYLRCLRLMLAAPKCN